MKSIFVGHGAPTIIWDKNEFTDLLKKYSQTIPKPKAIIIFTAHWESPVQLISSNTNYEMIYDFYGFPDELYKVKYPVAGDPGLAKKIHQVFLDNNIPSRLEANRGIDHGSWTMLKLLYPEADIPVVNMSVNTQLTASEQYRIGESLAQFKENDYLIIGSGGIVHNLRALKYEAHTVDSWAAEFNTWIADKLMNWDTAAIFEYENIAPKVRLAVPRNEHFINLLIAMGTGSQKQKARRLESIYQMGNLSLDLWEFE